MNFDNLVEDIRDIGGLIHADGNVFFTNTDKLKTLLIKYILADRAASGEPVDAILVSDCVDRTSALFGDGLFSTRDNITQLYTRAQPTPAQIAEIQAQALEHMAEEWSLQHVVGGRSLINKAASLRKGEPL